MSAKEDRNLVAADPSDRRDSAGATGVMISAALRIVNDAWQEVLRSAIVVQSRLGLQPLRFPDLSFPEIERRSRLGRSLLERLKLVDLAALPHELALTLRAVQFRAGIWSREKEWYWTVIDPLGEGFFGLFLPGAYCGGHVVSAINDHLTSFVFADRGDCDRYLALLSDYARVIEQFAFRTAGQAERGTRMPKVQVGQARALIEGLKGNAARAASVTPARLLEVSAAGFAEEVHERVNSLLEPAFDRVSAVLSPEYMTDAPADVGMSQYEGAREVYADLVKIYTTLDLTVDEVHTLGVKRQAEIAEALRRIRRETGCDEGHAKFVARVRADPRWRAETAEEVGAFLCRYIERLKPRTVDYFRSMPSAPYGVEPLPEALQGSMTAGYYDFARPGREAGMYLFNTRNLASQPLYQVGHLTYHELIPGHHLHISTLQEDKLLHPLRVYTYINAYFEGWAEYAASLAGEMGMYAEPEEEYGHLMKEAHLVSRLVVDTGVNMLGWSFGKCTEYMRSHTGLTEREIFTELVRYSCDIPAHALGYKIGDVEILAMREHMQGVLGPRFDIRDFHTAVLGAGVLPLPDLRWHIEAETRRLASLGMERRTNLDG